MELKNQVNRGDANNVTKQTVNRGDTKNVSKQTSA